MKLLVLSLFSVFSCSAAAETADLHKECFAQNKGRSCVRLGTTLWQTPASRDEARKAFAKGCELKVESACALKDLKPAAAAAAEKPPETKAVQKKGADLFIVSRSAALSYAADMQNTLSTAKMEAEKKPSGAVSGYRFVEIEEGSVFAALGFLVKDIVTHVNGRAITSPSEATAMLPGLAYKDRFAVQIIRGGKNAVQNYQLVD